MQANEKFRKTELTSEAKVQRFLSFTSYNCSALTHCHYRIYVNQINLIFNSPSLIALVA